MRWNAACVTKCIQQLELCRHFKRFFLVVSGKRGSNHRWTHNVIEYPMHFQKYSAGHLADSSNCSWWMAFQGQHTIVLARYTARYKKQYRGIRIFPKTCHTDEGSTCIMGQGHISAERQQAPVEKAWRYKQRAIETRPVLKDFKAFFKACFKDCKACFRAFFQGFLPFV